MLNPQQIREGQKTKERQLTSEFTKFGVGPDPLSAEEFVKEVVPSERWQSQRITEFLQKEAAKARDLIDQGALQDPPKAGLMAEQKARLTAIEMWAHDLKMVALGDDLKRDWVRDFLGFLRGKVSKEDAASVRAIWPAWDITKEPPSYRYRDVGQYLYLFVERQRKFVEKLLELRFTGPRDLPECYIVYKYLIKAEAMGPSGADFFYDMLDLPFYKDEPRVAVSSDTLAFREDARRVRPLPIPTAKPAPPPQFSETRDPNLEQMAQEEAAYEDVPKRTATPPPAPDADAEDVRSTPPEPMPEAAPAADPARYPILSTSNLSAMSNVWTAIASDPTMPMPFNNTSLYQVGDGGIYRSIQANQGPTYNSGYYMEPMAYQRAMFLLSNPSTFLAPKNGGSLAWPLRPLLMTPGEVRGAELYGKGKQGWQFRNGHLYPGAYETGKWHAQQLTIPRDPVMFATRAWDGWTTPAHSPTYADDPKIWQGTYEQFFPMAYMLTKGPGADGGFQFPVDGRWPSYGVPVPDYIGWTGLDFKTTSGDASVGGKFWYLSSHTIPSLIDLKHADAATLAKYAKYEIKPIDGVPFAGGRSGMVPTGIFGRQFNTFVEMAPSNILGTKHQAAQLGLRTIFMLVPDANHGRGQNITAAPLGQRMVWSGDVLPNTYYQTHGFRDFVGSYPGRSQDSEAMYVTSAYQGEPTPGGVMIVNGDMVVTGLHPDDQFALNGNPILVQFEDGEGNSLDDGRLAFMLTNSYPDAPPNNGAGLRTVYFYRPQTDTVEWGVISPKDWTAMTRQSPPDWPKYGESGMLVPWGLMGSTSRTQFLKTLSTTPAAYGYDMGKWNNSDNIGPNPTTQKDFIALTTLALNDVQTNSGYPLPTPGPPGPPTPSAAFWWWNTETTPPTIMYTPKDSQKREGGVQFDSVEWPTDPSPKDSQAFVQTIFGQQYTFKYNSTLGKFTSTTSDGAVFRMIEKSLAPAFSGVNGNTWQIYETTGHKGDWPYAEKVNPPVVNVLGSIATSNELRTWGQDFQSFATENPNPPEEPDEKVDAWKPVWLQNTGDDKTAPNVWVAFSYPQQTNSPVSVPYESNSMEWPPEFTPSFNKANFSFVRGYKHFYVNGVSYPLPAEAQNKTLVWADVGTETDVANGGEFWVRLFTDGVDDSELGTWQKWRWSAAEQTMRVDPNYVKADQKNLWSIVDPGPGPPGPGPAPKAPPGDYDWSWNPNAKSSGFNSAGLQPMDVNQIINPRVADIMDANRAVAYSTLLEFGLMPQAVDAQWGDLQRQLMSLGAALAATKAVAKPVEWATIKTGIQGALTAAGGVWNKAAYEAVDKILEQVLGTSVEEVNEVMGTDSPGGSSSAPPTTSEPAATLSEPAAEAPSTAKSKPTKYVIRFDGFHLGLLGKRRPAEHGDSDPYENTHDLTNGLHAMTPETYHLADGTIADAPEGWTPPPPMWNLENWPERAAWTSKTAEELVRRLDTPDSSLALDAHSKGSIHALQLLRAILRFDTKAKVRVRLDDPWASNEGMPEDSKTRQLTNSLESMGFIPNGLSKDDFASLKKFVKKQQSKGRIRYEYYKTGRKHIGFRTELAQALWKRKTYTPTAAEFSRFLKDHTQKGGGVMGTAGTAVGWADSAASAANTVLYRGGQVGAVLTGGNALYQGGRYLYDKVRRTEARTASLENPTKPGNESITGDVDAADKPDGPPGGSGSGKSANSIFGVPGDTPPPKKWYNFGGGQTQTPQVSPGTPGPSQSVSVVGASPTVPAVAPVAPYQPMTQETSESTGPPPVEKEHEYVDPESSSPLTHSNVTTSTTQKAKKSGRLQPDPRSPYPFRNPASGKIRRG